MHQRVCYAACDVVSWDPEYLGPAALNRAWTLFNDERHADPKDAATGDLGQRLQFLPHAGQLHEALSG